MNNSISTLLLVELKQLLEKKELSSHEIVSALEAEYLADQEQPNPLNGYVEFFADAKEAAALSDKKRNNGSAGPLEGLPFVVKDNILVRGHLATSASKILTGFKAPYSSTVVERLQQAGAVALGRTNLDAFGMGSSCEFSIYGATRNPVDRQKTAGGSSGGPAAVVAGNQAPLGLGTDTGGSIRLPASFCGIYGLKPTYGALSRYGVIAYGSSLDQIGLLARCPDDIGLVFQEGAGKDDHDATSEETAYKDLYPLKSKEIKGMKIAIPSQFMAEGLAPEIREGMQSFIKWLESRGGIVEEVSIPMLNFANAIYYIIAPAEASSNLARYDGVRYGFRHKDITNLDSLYMKSRSEGFGIEEKRRIFIGNYVLSSGYFDAYYKKAMEVRILLKNQIDETLSKHELILAPTSPCLPFNLGEKIDDPLALYLTDICTTFVNLAKVPSLAFPCGKTSTGIPVGLQLVGPQFSEPLLLSVAKTWYNKEEK